MTWWRVLGAALLVLAVFLDVYSLRLFRARVRRGYGPSGLPTVPLVIYWAVVAGWGGGSWWVRGPLLAALTALHFAVNLVIPELHYRRTGGRR